MIYYFASINNDNFVDQVHIVGIENCLDENGEYDESIAIDFCNRTFGQSRWLRTCREGSIRYNYAGVGYYYYEEYDAFVQPRISNSAILTDTFNWSEIDLTDFLSTIELD